MGNNIRRFGKMLFVEGDKVYANDVIFDIADADPEEYSSIRESLGNDPIAIIEYTEFWKRQRVVVTDKTFYNGAIAFITDNQKEFYTFMHEHYRMTKSEFNEAFIKFRNLEYFDDNAALPDILKRVQKSWNELLISIGITSEEGSQYMKEWGRYTILLDMADARMPDQKEIDQVIAYLKKMKEK